MLPPLQLAWHGTGEQAFHLRQYTWKQAKTDGEGPVAPRQRPLTSAEAVGAAPRNVPSASSPALHRLGTFSCSGATGAPSPRPLVPQSRFNLTGGYHSSLQRGSGAWTLRQPSPYMCFCRKPQCSRCSGKRTLDCGDVAPLGVLFSIRRRMTPTELLCKKVLLLWFTQ